MNRPMILIVGVQKSGTTLLMRLLEQSGVCKSPFPHEGDEFWGNVPPFEPRGFPAGTIYQRSGGEHGHEIGVEDATEEIRQALHARLAAVNPTRAVLVNKCPYNTVRLPWIRSLFPEAFIVAMVRDPVANVFSLMKKYIPHKDRGQAPLDGWWGVKPRGWRDMVDDDKARQCARQWNAVYQILFRDARHVNLMIPYSDLCARPEELVRSILAPVGHDLGESPGAFPPIRCFDHEFSSGARLRSKNRYFRSTGTLVVPVQEPIELGPLSEAAIDTIKSVCGQTLNQFEIQP